MQEPGDPSARPDDQERPLTRRELRLRREQVAPTTATAPEAAPGSVAAAPTASSSFGSVASMFTPTVRQQTSTRPTVLTVCTGNICRSPLAENLLHTHLSSLGVRVHSAGTHGLVGHAMTDQAQRIAHAQGGDEDHAAAHAARRLDEGMLDDADLILTMTAEQSDFAVQMMPRRLHRTFPVREFARLAATLSDQQVRTAADAAGADPRARLVAAVTAVAAQRSYAPPARSDEDVIDPYRQPFSVYEQSAAQLTPALAEVERVVKAAVG
ncbi:low molecular weight phosphatase family protein [Microbacterium sp.]|uniref:arsenate reductase/protein-tyrosine-phosphatase family protein n=1 Tax=Microbacterium sp. TaxID=51671 RepID=UPI0033412015